MSTRELVLKMQRIILRQLKNDVLRLQGPMSGELAQYAHRYQNEFKKYQRVSSKKELIAAASKAHIVFGGDFHAFSQSQRTHLRILREMVRFKRPLILALESVEAKYQKVIEEFLAEDISEKVFLEKIKYVKNWGFPWENYKVFFDFARKNKLKVYGINYQKPSHKVGDLEERDRASSKKIAEITVKNPQALIYVLFGDLHVAKDHLPHFTREILGKKVKIVSIFQNSERLYWKLAHKKLEEKVEVLQLRKDAFCIVNTPPWYKWQSYLDFLEKRTDGDENSDLVDSIHKYSQLICQILGVPGKFYDFHVFKKGDVRLASHLSKKTNKKEKKFIEKLIHQNRSFFIPRVNVFYVTKTDTNHVLSLVGQFIHAQLRKEKNVHLQMPECFEAVVWNDAIAFFISKIINSRRKFPIISPTAAQSQTSLISLEYRLKERLAFQTGNKIKRLKKSRFKRQFHFFEAARIVGSIWGQKIYDGFIQGELEADRLKSWMCQPVNKKSGFSVFYLNALLEVSRLKLSSVRPEERL